jgi:hypothetical protein
MNAFVLMKVSWPDRPGQRQPATPDELLEVLAFWHRTGQVEDRCWLVDKQNLDYLKTLLDEHDC